jgi:transposase
MAYPSDLKDKQWEVIKHHFVCGNRSKYSKRVLINGVLYVVRSGCQWRLLPHDFPNWKTVYTFYRRMCKASIWEQILDELVIRTRAQSGRDWEPTFCIIDSQSVKTIGAAQERGIDGGKKNQRKKKTHRN